MSEEQRLARNIQVLSNGKLEARNLDTCMTYGISGLCGKECPKFKDKTCEVYLDTLEKEYNSLQKQLQQKENIIKEVREYIMSELITEWDIKNGGCVSGSDLPTYAITPILEILDKGSDSNVKD